MASRRSLVLPFALVSVLSVGSVQIACSSSDRPPASGASSSGTVVPPSGHPDAATDGPVVPPSGPDGGSKTPLGSLPTTDEPDVPCVSPGGTSTLLFAASSFPTTGAPPARLAQTLGTKVFATGANMGGFATFDPLGTSPQFFASAFGNSLVAYTSEGTTIGGYVVDTGNLKYQRYDGAGATSGAPVTIGSIASPGGLWVAAGGGGSIAIWADGTDVKVGGVAANGTAAGAPWTLVSNAASTRVAATYANGKYVIAYSYTSGGQTFAKLQFADATGASGAAKDITSGTGTIIVVAIVPTSVGFLLAFDGGGDDLVYLVPLDGSGVVNGTARRLLGGDEPYALASRGGDVGLVTMSNDVKVNNQEGPRKPQFRAVDTIGHPLAPWICLDNQIPAAQTQDMAVLAETNGYSVVYKTVSNDTKLQRFDHLGTGNP